jgi:photosystem II stability/assembly factor-like uncharacterized protein
MIRFPQITLIAIMLTTVSAAADPTPWRWLAPLPQGNPLHAAATGGQRLVAVGDNGAILTKPAGSATWEVVDTSALVPANSPQ